MTPEVEDVVLAVEQGIKDRFVNFFGPDSNGDLYLQGDPPEADALEILLDVVRREFQAAIAAMREHEKPKWEDAPEWAQWLAQNEIGNWNWYLVEPSAEHGYWDGYGVSTPAGGRTEDWQSTLEQREGG